MSKIAMSSLKSSMLQAHGYDAASKTLAIRFSGAGKTYHYSGVPPEVASGLAAAESPGKFFGQVIRGKFGHVPVED